MFKTTFPPPAHENFLVSLATLHIYIHLSLARVTDGEISLKKNCLPTKGFTTLSNKKHGTTWIYRRLHIENKISEFYFFSEFDFWPLEGNDFLEVLRIRAIQSPIEEASHLPTDGRFVHLFVLCPKRMADSIKKCNDL